MGLTPMMATHSPGSNWPVSFEASAATASTCFSFFVISGRLLLGLGLLRRLRLLGRRLFRLVLEALELQPVQLERAEQLLRVGVTPGAAGGEAAGHRDAHHRAPQLDALRALEQLRGRVRSVVGLLLGAVPLLQHQLQAVVVDAALGEPESEEL